MKIEPRLAVVMILVASALGGRANASSFFSLDARSAAMGGVGIASGVKSAPLTNPALLAYGVEFVDWYMTVPAYSAVRSDPDNFSNLLDDFQKSADALDANRDSAREQSAAASLDKLTKAKRIENTGSSLFASIPSNILGAGAYLNFYQFASVRAVANNPNVKTTPPTYNTVIEKRGVSVAEHGISLAQVFTTDFRGFDTFALGINPKIILFQAAGANEPVENANAKVGFGGSRNGSAFNLDVGLFKELGRFYSGGLLVRNLLPVKVKYPDAIGGHDKLSTQVRAGIAYERRTRSIEVDLDLVPNSGIGFERRSRMLSIGGEFVLTQYLQLRAGLRQNLLGDNQSLVTFGMGFGTDYILDLAVAGGTDELDVTAQFTFAF
jgi:hypothetical protein